MVRAMVMVSGMVRVRGCKMLEYFPGGGCGVQQLAAGPGKWCNRQRDTARYLHSIYTVSTQYLHSIYSIRTASRVFHGHGGPTAARAPRTLAGALTRTVPLLGTRQRSSCQ